MYYKVDCKNYETMHEIFLGLENIAGIIHFAAFKSVSESVTVPLKYYNNNIGSLATILQLVQEEENSKFGIFFLLYSLWSGRSASCNRTDSNEGGGIAIQVGEQMKLNYKIVPRRDGDIEQIYADTNKSNLLVNWKAQYGIKEALRDAWNWELNIAKMKAIA